MLVFLKRKERKNTINNYVQLRDKKEDRARDTVRMRKSFLIELFNKSINGQISKCVNRALSPAVKVSALLTNWYAELIRAHSTCHRSVFTGI